MASFWNDLLEKLNPAGLLQDALSDPEIRKLLLRTARDALRAKGRYRETHWGRDDEGVGTIDVPDPDGRPLAELGALAMVGYVTRKGKERAPSVYVHEFDRPFPWLYEDGKELFILRERSRFDVRDVRRDSYRSHYTITAHGIEG